MRLMVAGATSTVEEMLGDADVGPVLGAMITPNTGNSVSRVASWGVPWCIDNACFDQSRFDAPAFLRLCERARLAARPPEWVVVPDVVGDHAATLARFWEWLPRMLRFRLPLAFVAQDGIDARLDDVPWSFVSCVFVGGGDDFKDDMTMHIAERCRAEGKLCHVGRVNGRRRLRLALHSGCDSVDGSSLSRFARTWLPVFARHLRELHAEGEALDRLALDLPRTPPARPRGQLLLW